MNSEDRYMLWASPTHVCVRRGSYATGDTDRFVLRTTVAQLQRIESLRSRAIMLLQNLYRRLGEIEREIVHCKEAFIPIECYPVQELKGLDDVDDDDRAYLTNPRRVVAIRDQGGRCENGWYVTYDYDYWKRTPAKLVAKGKSALSDLADVGDLRDWELECERRRASISPEKLALGRRYHELNERIHVLRGRKTFLDEMLELGVRLTGIIRPEDPHGAKRQVCVEINNRLYQFITDRDRISGMPELWPWPGETQVVKAPTTFHVDDSLLGHNMDVVRTRLGEPNDVIGKSVWVYGQQAIKFDAERRVKSFLNDKQIAALRKSNARRRSMSKGKKKRAVRHA